MIYGKSKNYDIWLKIGLNILHYRKEQGLTQEQLAEKCNISRTYMQKIETASSSCSLDTLIDISRSLNIPLKKYLNSEIRSYLFGIKFISFR